MAIIADDAWNGWDSYDSASVTNTITDGVLSCVSGSGLRAQRYLNVAAMPGDVIDFYVEAKVTTGKAHLFCNVATIAGTVLADRDVRSDQWIPYSLQVVVPTKYDPGLVTIAVGTYASDSLSCSAQFMHPIVRRNGAPVLSGFTQDGLALNAIGGVTLWARGNPVFALAGGDTIMTGTEVVDFLASQLAVQSNASWTAETKAYISRYPVVPVDGYINAVDTLIRALKDTPTGNFWSGLDMIFLLNSTERAGSLVNARAPNPNHPAVLVGSPNWLAKDGWQGTGVSSYLNTRYNPGDGGTYNLIQNSASMGFWASTNIQVASGGYDFGNDNHCIVARAALGPNAFYSRNSSPTSGNVIPGTLGAGHYVTDRAGSANYQRYQGLAANSTMTALASQTGTSTGLVSQEFLISRRPGNPISNTNRYSIVHAGRGNHSAGEWNAIQAAFKTYVDTVTAL